MNKKNRNYIIFTIIFLTICEASIYSFLGIKFDIKFFSPIFLFLFLPTSSIINAIFFHLVHIYLYIKDKEKQENKI